MIPRRLLVFTLSAAALAAVPGLAAMGGGKPPKQDSQVSLVRPDPAPDPDATGSLRIREHKNDQRFDVHVEHVDTGAQHDVFIEDPADSAAMVFVAGLGVQGNGLTLSLDTKQGDALPLGAASLDDLIGRHVEVRAGADVILKGVVPPWDLSSKPATASTQISPPDGAPAPKMSAKLSLRSKADKGQERIDLKVHGVPWGSGPFHVFIEDHSGSDTFTEVGQLDKLGDSEGRWRRDTKQGQALPFDVGFVSELAGRALEVRDDGGVAFLHGLIPALK